MEEEEQIKLAKGLRLSMSKTIPEEEVQLVQVQVQVKAAELILLQVGDPETWCVVEVEDSLLHLRLGNVSHTHTHTHTTHSWNFISSD